MTVGRKKVLVVDDSRSIRHMVRYVLASAGYQADEAGNGEEAMVKLAQDGFDLVLLDINMPVMDGFETLETLRSNGRLSSTRVAMMTTEVGEEERKRAAEAGAVDYLAKPFQPGQLLELVNQALGEEADDT